MRRSLLKLSFLPLALATIFPSLHDTSEYALLSQTIYRFRNMLDETVCGSSFLRGTAAFNLTNWNCRWYHHDQEQGTQVMLVKSKLKPLLVVVFAGTDDLKTALTDADVATKQLNGLFPYVDPHVRIHSGFYNSIAAVWNNLTAHVIAELDAPTVLATTGHSLGAAHAILTAVGLSEQLNRTVTTVNFGCPKLGNWYWREFLVNNASAVEAWRVVLDWDLVPRLPEFMYHVGHTIQMEKNTTLAYYEHYGDETNRAGVPVGWNAKPFLWVPGALQSHHMGKYASVLRAMDLQRFSWPQDFVLVSNTSSKTSDDNPLLNVDDDVYVQPPDDNNAMKADPVVSIM